MTVIINPELFRKTCIEVLLENRDTKFDFKGKNACPTHWLKLPYQRIAADYLPHYKNNKQQTLFPASIIQNIAQRMNLYVTDLIRF